MTQVETDRREAGPSTRDAGADEIVSERLEMKVMGLLGAMLKIALNCAAITSLCALPMWLCALIILPEVGLSVPGYWAWWKFCAVVVSAYAAIVCVRELTEGA